MVRFWYLLFWPSNLGLFANFGYRLNKNQILSIYSRNDDHKETGGNKTYKLNFTQFFGPMKLGLTHSTGLKNASLYELYGNIGQKNINPPCLITCHQLDSYMALGGMN